MVFMLLRKKRAAAQDPPAVMVDIAEVELDELEPERSWIAENAVRVAIVLALLSVAVATGLVIYYEYFM